MGNWVEEGWLVGVWVYTWILISIKVLASSQSESISRQAVTVSPGCSQLLAQHQALCGYIPVSIKDQYSASTLLSSEWTAHRHVYSGDNRHTHGLDISMANAPLRQKQRKTYSIGRTQSRKDHPPFFFNCLVYSILIISLYVYYVVIALIPSYQVLQST